MSVLQLARSTSVHAESGDLGWKRTCNLKNVIGVIIILICSFLKAVALRVFLNVVENVTFNLNHLSHCRLLCPGIFFSAAGPRERLPIVFVMFD